MIALLKSISKVFKWVVEIFRVFKVVRLFEKAPEEDGRDGEKSSLPSYYLTVNWGTVITVVATIIIAIVGGMWKLNVSAHEEMNKNLTKHVDIVIKNCEDIEVLKAKQIMYSETLGEIKKTLVDIRRDQLDYYKYKGFFPKPLPPVLPSLSLKAMPDREKAK